jgi:hypothetical protein
MKLKRSLDLSLVSPGTRKDPKLLMKIAKHSIPIEDVRHTRNKADVDNCQM